MFDLDTWQEIFESIRKHPVRSILTAFGVSWGIFMLVLLLGAGKGLQNGVEYEFRDDAVNSIWIYRGRTSIPFNGLPEGRRLQFTNENFSEMIDHFKQFDYATGRFYIAGERIVKHGDKALSFNVRSVHPDHQYLENTMITKGRYLSQGDLANFKKVAVIGRIVVENLFGEKEAVGKYISINDASYKVVGVFEDSGGENEMRNIYIPITTAQKVYGGGSTIHQYMLAADNLSLEEMNALEDELRVFMAQTHEFDPKDRKALFVNNLAEEFQEFQELFAMIRAFVWLVGIGSIIAGVIGISNIMLIVVKERTKEIGVRKAMGATPNSIISMIMQESIFLTALSGYLGLVAGILILFALQSAEVPYFRNPNVSIWIGMEALVVLVVCGALAGLIPAIQAARINPIKAIKSE